MARYKGLTSGQRDRILIACREDTCVDDGGGFPARQSDITTPSNGDNLEVWTDASRGGAFWSARSDDTPSYNSSGGVDLDSSSTEDMHIVGDVTTKNLQYFERFRTGAFTFVIKVDLQTEPGTSSTNTVIGSTDGDSSGTGFALKYEKDGSDNMGFRAYTVQGGTTIWSTGFVKVTSLPTSGFDTFIINQTSDPKVTIDVNGTQEFSDSNFSLQSTGTNDTNVMGLGTAGGLTTDGNLDAIIQGMLLDDQSGNGQAAKAWIGGQNYTP